MDLSGIDDDNFISMKFQMFTSLTKKNSDLHGFQDVLNEDDIYKLQICTVML